jgi:hypothetical protein
VAVSFIGGGNYSLGEDSMMFRCTISANGFVEELKYDLTVKKEDAGKFC